MAHHYDLKIDLKRKKHNLEDYIQQLQNNIEQIKKFQTEYANHIPKALYDPIKNELTKHTSWLREKQQELSKTNEYLDEGLTSIGLMEF